MTSTSLSYRVALHFAQGAVNSDPTTSDDLHNVLFAICLRNYEGFHGFRMNSALYGAHPDENEILLIEGVDMHVLGVEEMEIENLLTGDDFWDNLAIRRVTVIYLFHN